jgi:hypothetical protein
MSAEHDQILGSKIVKDMMEMRKLPKEQFEE